MLLDAQEISDSGPLLRYYVDSATHEIILSFLGNVQMEVTCALLQKKVSCGDSKKRALIIWLWKDR